MNLLYIYVRITDTHIVLILNASAYVYNFKTYFSSYINNKENIEVMRITNITINGGTVFSIVCGAMYFGSDHLVRTNKQKLF